MVRHCQTLGCRNPAEKICQCSPVQYCVEHPCKHCEGSRQSTRLLEDLDSNQVAQLVESLKGLEDVATQLVARQPENFKQICTRLWKIRSQVLQCISLQRWPPQSELATFLLAPDEANIETVCFRNHFPEDPRLAESIDVVYQEALTAVLGIADSRNADLFRKVLVKRRVKKQREFIYMQLKNANLLKVDVSMDLVPHSPYQQFELTTDGRFLVSVSNKTLRVTTFPLGELLSSEELGPRSDKVDVKLAVSPCGSSVTIVENISSSLSYATLIRWFSLSRNGELTPVHLASLQLVIKHLQFVNEQTLYLATDSTIYWFTPGRDQLMELIQHEGPSIVCMKATDEYIAVTTKEREIFVYDISSASIRNVVTHSITTAVFTLESILARNQEKLVINTSWNFNVFTNMCEPLFAVNTVPWMLGALIECALSPCGRLIAFVEKQPKSKKVVVWSLLTGERVCAFDLAVGGSRTQLKFSPCSGYLFATNTRMSVWKLWSG